MGFPTHRLAACAVALVLVLALGLAWVERGSIDRGDWLPYSFLLALALAAVLLAGVAGRPSRAATIALAALGGLAAWNAVSLAWAPSPSLGRDEALLVLSGATAFALVATTATGHAARVASAVLLAAFSASAALAMGVVALVDDDPTGLYRSGRLEAPIGYTNALAAVFLLGFWPAVGIAGHPASRLYVRAAAMAGAAAMLAGELQVQSKGAGLGLVAAGALLAVLSSRRARLLLPAALVAACVVPAADRLTEPFRLQEARAAAEIDAIRSAAATLLLVSLLAAAVGILYGIVQARVTVPPRVQRRLSRAAGAAVAVALVVGLAWGAASMERIDTWASERWEDFTDYGGQQLEASSNFGSLGSSRYDSWRVAVEGFAEAPLHGGGARSFRAAYLLHGKTPDTPERSHSLELDVLSETGLVGFALLLAALVPPLLVLVRRARRSLVDASLLGAAAAWLAHASVDWIWTMPVLLLPFLALLAAGSSPDERRPLFARTGTAAAVVVVVAVGCFMPPWLSSRLTDQGLARGRPGADALEWARRLDPLAVDPLLAEAKLARSPAEAIPPLRAAVRKEPESAALHYFLGIELTRAGRRAEALAELEEARRLYPRGTEIRDALRRLRSPG